MELKFTSPLRLYGVMLIQIQGPLIFCNAKSYGKIIYTDLEVRKIIGHCVIIGALSNVQIV